MTQAILYLTDKDDVRSARLFFEDATDTNFNVYVLLNQKKSGRLISLSEPLQNRIIPFRSDIICQMEYKPIGDSLVPGNAHFPVLRFYKEYPNYDYYWVVEDDVRYTGRWKDFFCAFVNDDSDLLASYITHYNDDMAWTWWYTFSSAGEKVAPSDMVRSFNPIYRLSNRALKAIHEKMAIGWTGHFEVLIPTYCLSKG